MATKTSEIKVEKPYLTGSFHGRDAWKLVPKRLLAMLGVFLLYFAGSLMLSFDSLAGRIIPSVLIVALTVYYQAMKGMAQGTGDVAFGEMMNSRLQEGKTVSPQDRQKCYHPLKGFFVAIMGVLPFLLVASYFALNARAVEYSLGVLPSWTQELMQQSEFGDALRYYEQVSPMTVMEALRVGVRAVTMPMMSVATFVGGQATLLAERLSPLFLLLAPLAYGFGYLAGPEQRIRINTGIQLGVNQKRRKERKARKKRSQSRGPERLI